MSPEVVNIFWFEKLSPKNWFEKNDDLDKTIKDQFGATLEKAKKGKLFEWRSTPK